MALSTYYRDKLLDHLYKGSSMSQPANIYMSCHTADPGTTGASEVSGGSYARQLVTSSLAAASGGSKTTNANVDFTLMPACTVTDIGFWDAVTGGNFIQPAHLGSSVGVSAGNTFRIATGAVTITDNT